MNTTGSFQRPALTSERSSLHAVINKHHPRENTSVVKQRNPYVSLTIIAEVVAHDIGVTLADLRARNRRHPTIVEHRPFAMYLAYEMNGARVSTSRVGSFFGRNHTTVLYAIRKVNERRAVEPEVQTLLDTLRAAILAVCAQLATSEDPHERALLEQL